jgi:DnaD/phage-associated family protein
MLFSDINIPEVFITEHMCAANGDYIKIYIYCIFLCKYGGEITPTDLSKKLCLPFKTVEEGLKYWEDCGVITKKQSTYTLSDLKKLEVDKLYKPKLTSSVEDAIACNSRNISRTQAINAINSMFFQGVMSPTWYTDIDNMFSKYHFDEAVMLALFQYCFDRRALHKKYLYAVAEGWASNGIKNLNDLDKYYLEYEKLAQIKKDISKKLGLIRKLSQYEEAYIEKWVVDFKYSLEIIEIALKKTTSKTNPSFDYIDKILSDWYERKLNTSDEINNFLKDQKQKQKEIKQMNEKPSVVYTKDKGNQFVDVNKYYTNIKKSGV